MQKQVFAQQRSSINEYLIGRAPDRSDQARWRTSPIAEADETFYAQISHRWQHRAKKLQTRRWRALKNNPQAE